MPEGSFTDAASLSFTSADLRFTQRVEPGRTLVYAMGMVRPEDGVVRVRTLGGASALSARDVGEVWLLGHPGPLPVRRTDDALEVVLPPTLPPAVQAVPGFALRIALPDPAAPAPRALLLPDGEGGG